MAGQCLGPTAAAARCHVLAHAQAAGRTGPALLPVGLLSPACCCSIALKTGRSGCQPRCGGRRQPVVICRYQIVYSDCQVHAPEVAEGRTCRDGKLTPGRTRVTSAAAHQKAGT
jgi:hypothetical protein